MEFQNIEMIYLYYYIYFFTVYLFVEMFEFTMSYVLWLKI